ncbi:MAG TPA: M15 family metallopeptidase [Gemmatimonadaceae bacterium]|nr:M15 family metallopeptidase [Gemmatimonadaceae bacterium]
MLAFRATAPRTGRDSLRQAVAARLSVARWGAPQDPAGPKPRPVSVAFAGLIGEYGAEGDTVLVLERGGRLFALSAGPETALVRSHFAQSGVGRPPSLRIGGRTLPRRAVGTEEGVTFRVTPLSPVDSLRRSALAASPPTEQRHLRAGDLVEVAILEPRVRLDIRYASTNNFLGAPMYSSARAFLQRPAAEALVRAHRRLAAYGYGLLIHDAYRPWFVTKMFWDATSGSQHQFVADPASGSRHNRGAAVDLTLYDLKTGKPVRMPGGYDEFSHRSYADYPGGTALERWLRHLLRREMEAQGFAVNPSEWWHFDYSGWKEFPLLNVPFEQVGQKAAALPARRSR